MIKATLTTLQVQMYLKLIFATDIGLSNTSISLGQAKDL